MGHIDDTYPFWVQIWTLSSPNYYAICLDHLNATSDPISVIGVVVVIDDDARVRVAIQIVCTREKRLPLRAVLTFILSQSMGELKATQVAINDNFRTSCRVGNPAPRTRWWWWRRWMAGARYARRYRRPALRKDGGDGQAKRQPVIKQESGDHESSSTKKVSLDQRGSNALPGQVLTQS